MNIIKIQYFKTEYGELILGSFQEELCLCDWRYRKKRSSIDTRIQQGLNASYQEQKCNLIETAIKKLNEYFRKERELFDIPVILPGSEFQKRTWEQLRKIPYGESISYLELSRQLAGPESVRAVAAANGANALSIIVPCHRVIGSDGKLNAYAGGVQAKKKLLMLENAHFDLQLELF